MCSRSDIWRPAHLAPILFAGLLLAAPITAQTCAPAPGQAPVLSTADWNTILLKRGIDINKDDLAVLVFDHSSTSWSIYHRPHGGEPFEQAERFGPDGNPLVLRTGSEKLLILVTRTNPFLYAYEGVVLPPQDSPDAATLKTLAGALGSAISAIAKEGEVKRVTTSSLDKALAALATLQNSLLDAEQVRLNVRAFVQAFEFDPGSAPLSGLNPYAIHQSEQAVLRSFENVRAARADLNKRGLPAACFQPWAALLSLLEIELPGDDELKKVIQDLHKWFATAPEPCRETFRAKLTALDELAKAKGEDRKEKIQNLREDEKLAAIRVVLAIDQALAAEKDAIAALASANAFARIAEDHLGLDGSGSTARYVALPRTCTALLSPPFPAQTWLKDNPGTLSIKPEGAVCADCVHLRPTVTEKKYLLASRRQNVLGLGFGLIYTTITDPTFGAVNAGNGTQVIARTSEDSRSGAIAIFGSLRLRATLAKNKKPTWWEPCVDLGAGLDVKQPSLFVGLSVEILRYARIGFGQTWQVVTRLDDGLSEAQYGSDGHPIPGTGTTVSSAADIRTRNTVTSRPYLSLTFSVDALPFFQPK